MRTYDDAGSGSLRRRRVTVTEARLNRQREPLPTDVDLLPQLAPEYDRALDRMLTGLGLEVTAEARATIARHVRLLLAWTAAINLTAITDPGEVARLHVGDSLAAVPLVRDLPTGRILDLGSGGGFPGVPLAATLPGARVELVDSIAKKARFLEVAVAAAGLADRVAVRPVRAEALPRDRPWDVVTARAVGSLPDLVELALPLLDRGGRLVAWKRDGPDLPAELAAGARAAAGLGAGPPLRHEVPAAAGLPGHVLIVVEKRGSTPPGFPRDPAARRRRPW